MENKKYNVPKAGDHFGEFTVTELTVKGITRYFEFVDEFKENFERTQPKWEEFARSEEGHAALFYISKVGF